MLRERESKFKLYSKGIVAVDKARGSKIIKVTPIEEFPHLDKPLSEVSIEYDTELPDSQGSVQRSKITGNAMIEAEWLGMHQGNRLTAPDVIKGETVNIYRYADSEKYYWDTQGREDGVRRLETVTWGFNNSATPLEECGEDKQYRMTVSTHDQKIQMKTSDSNGEVTTYDITFDMKSGNLSITDKQGNTITLDSVKGDVNMESNRTLTIKTRRVTIDAPQTIIKGDLIVKGAVSISGNMAGGGAFALAGSGSIQGDLTVQGTIRGGTIQEI